MEYNDKQQNIILGIRLLTLSVAILYLVIIAEWKWLWLFPLIGYIIEKALGLHYKKRSKKKKRRRTKSEERSTQSKSSNLSSEKTRGSAPIKSESFELSKEDLERRKRREKRALLKSGESRVFAPALTDEASKPTKKRLPLPNKDSLVDFFLEQTSTQTTSDVQYDILAKNRSFREMQKENVEQAFSEINEGIPEDLDSEVQKELKERYIQIKMNELQAQIDMEELQRKQKVESEKVASVRATSSEAEEIPDVPKVIDFSSHQTKRVPSVTSVPEEDTFNKEDFIVRISQFDLPLKPHEVPDWEKIIQVIYMGEPIYTEGELRGTALDYDLDVEIVNRNLKVMPSKSINQKVRVLRKGQVIHVFDLLIEERDAYTGKVIISDQQADVFEEEAEDWTEQREVLMNVIQPTSSISIDSLLPEDEQEEKVEQKTEETVENQDALSVLEKPLITQKQEDPVVVIAEEKVEKKKQKEKRLVPTGTNTIIGNVKIREYETEEKTEDDFSNTEKRKVEVKGDIKDRIILFAEEDQQENYLNKLDFYDEQDQKINKQLITLLNYPKKMSTRKTGKKQVKFRIDFPDGTYGEVSPTFYFLNRPDTIGYNKGNITVEDIIPDKAMQS